MFKSTFQFLALLMLIEGSSMFALAQKNDLAIAPPATEGIVRVATFNVSLHRKAYGELARDLRSGDEQAKKIAAIVQAVAPDIILANEVDYDGGESARLLLDRYLRDPKNPRSLRHAYAAEVNTGLPSGNDLDGDGKVHGANDAFGFGEYPGQYGFAIFSRYPIDEAAVQSFQKFLWSEMPEALRPMKSDGTPFWSDAIWKSLRLSSKTHLDVPILIDGKRLHLIVSHPTPPVFDGPEDRNGCRNHDEIRLIHDYIMGGANAKYIRSDQGKVGGLGQAAHFIILGDLNADPEDGSGQSDAIRTLLDCSRVAATQAPRSEGGRQATEVQGGINQRHRGKPEEDTSDFNDRNTGNLRCDFVLPSNNCRMLDSGVFWPTKEELESVDRDLLSASDHRLVWGDLRLE